MRSVCLVLVALALLPLVAAAPLDDIFLPRYFARFDPTTEDPSAVGWRANAMAALPPRGQRGHSQSSFFAVQQEVHPHRARPSLPALLSSHPKVSSADVCSIPSAPASQTRESVLTSLAQSAATSLDLTASPCDNMYRFACGGWLDRHNETSIPKDVSSWSKSFSVIDKRNEKILREILECSMLRAEQADGFTHVEPDASAENDTDSGKVVDENAATPENADPLFLAAANDLEPSPDEIQLGRMYAACMNTAIRDQRGSLPLDPLFAQVENVTDADSAMEVAGALARDYLVAFFFNLGIGVSPADPSRYVFSVTQGGYPFPSRDLLVGPTNVSAAYTKHIAASMLHAELEPTEEAATEAAQRIVAFQTALARVAMAPEELRVPEAVNNLMPISELEAKSGLPFLSYLRLAFRNASLSADSLVNVGQPKQLAALGELMRSTPPQTLRDVMRWTVLLSFANDLDEELSRLHFNFFGHTISGTPQQAPLWKRCQAKALAWMADALSAEYVRVAFSPETEARARDLLFVAQQAFLRRLPSLTWMTDEDKEKAAAKLAAMATLVGANAPDKRINFSAVPLSHIDHFSNAVALRMANFNDTKNRFYETVDRERFQMPAAQVNAYVLLCSAPTQL